MTPEKWIQTAIRIPKFYNDEERIAIAQDILDRIRERTTVDNEDKNGKEFPGYSEEYMNSPAFKYGGKSEDDVNLVLSGDMLTVMRLIDHEPGKLIIGFDSSDDESGRAEGNIRGSYGKPRGNKSQARDFLGLSKQDLQRILEFYPRDDEELRRESTEMSLEAASLAQKILEQGGLLIDDLDSGDL